MKKNIDDLSENIIDINKNEILNCNNKEAKKLIHLPFYKLEELKNKESKKLKPPPKPKKREDHNMPKIQKHSEIKLKKKRIILKQNPSDTINLDLNFELNPKKIQRKISDFSTEKNLVETIFSDESVHKLKNLKLTSIIFF